MVLKTLAQLDRASGVRFEVIVVENNTCDPNLLSVVDDYCTTRSPQFRFIRAGRLPGAKGEALNVALAHTDPCAEAIAVVDSDYLLQPWFLALAISELERDPSVAFVQAPQDYRNMPSAGAGRGRYWEYAQFFAAGMRIRARRNAILMHGTMAVIRRTALEEAGGWAHWCVTEDSELGLRILARGHRAVYLTESHGRGLMPLTSADYRQQRRRWVTGGAQTLRRHWRLLLLPRSGELTMTQKLHHLQGWLPWARDGLQVLAIAPVFALTGAAATGVSVPWTAPLGAGLVVVFAHVVIRQALLMPRLLSLGSGDAARMAVVTTGLMWPIGTAWLVGTLTGRGQFTRTPKARALTSRSCAAEIRAGLCGALCLGLGTTAVLRDDTLAWLAAGCICLGLQILAGAYGATILAGEPEVDAEPVRNAPSRAMPPALQSSG